MISAGDCFKEGLLIKTRPNLDLAKKDLKQANFFLNETKDLLKIKKKEMASISLYNAFFHAARSLLFKDGVKEKSHYCLARYIEEKYAKPGHLQPEFVAIIDRVRDLRHEVQYGLSRFELSENLHELLERCQDFITVVEKLLPT